MSDIRIQKIGGPDILQASGGRLTLSLPTQIKRRSGRKLVTLLNGEFALVRPWDVTPTSFQLALVTGYRRLAMLESGEVKALKEIAVREGIDNSYISWMVNLTALAPDIVVTILDDAWPKRITLFDLAVDRPVLGDEQRRRVEHQCLHASGQYCGIREPSHTAVGFAAVSVIQPQLAAGESGPTAGTADRPPLRGGTGSFSVNSVAERMATWPLAAQIAASLTRRR